MAEERRYSSTELSTVQREIIARLVVPLEARKIPRSQDDSRINSKMVAK